MEINLSYGKVKKNDLHQSDFSTAQAESLKGAILEKGSSSFLVRLFTIASEECHGINNSPSATSSLS